MRQLRIFLAEDNKADVFLVRQALQAHQIEHELHVVSDGADAINYVLQMGRAENIPCPDLLLLDLNLPSADGPKILGEFRKHSTCSLTPVIIITSSDAPKDRARVAALGISYYFRKPMDLDEFMKLGAVVLKVLEGNGA